MDTNRTSYTAEEKMQIILGILTKKTSIQKVAQEKGIAPTLISLWKKQALEAVESRFQPQPKGRKKGAAAPVAEGAALKAARNETRAAKIRASHLEKSLRETREKLAGIEAQLQTLASGFGCKLVKERKPRKARKA